MTGASLPRRAAPAITTHRRPGYRLVRGFWALAFHSVWSLRVEGLEHVPEQGGVLLAANHQSLLDIPMLAVAVHHRHVCFVARESLTRSRFMAWLIRETGGVLVRRGQPDRRALEEMIAHLEADDCVAVFPEGTRSRDGRVGEFKKGALVSARRAGVPIVPVAIRGALEAWPRDRRLPRPGRLALRFSPPIEPTRDALERCRERIAALVGDGSYGAFGQAP